ncbi:UNVERIFIED_CONTAM: hypothetical protein Sradi_1875300, partial [Sesamum radiatum]
MGPLKAQRPVRKSDLCVPRASREYHQYSRRTTCIHRGLQICIDRGFCNVWIETDATAIIKLIISPQRGAWNLQTTLQSIRKLLCQMEYKISHIFREGNQAADFLANQTCNTQQLCIFLEDVIP